MARFFIDRPIFAWVIAIVIMLAGALSIDELPVSQYPPIAPPAIVINATYPGASAKTLEDSVTQIIEQKMTGIDNLLYMSSSSDSYGRASVTLTFNAGTNPDIAQVQVQNKLQLAMPSLPQIVQAQGVQVAKSSRNFLLIVGLVSEKNDQTQTDLTDYLVANMQDPLSRIPGVGEVTVFGSQYAMRIWLDPAKLVNYKLTTADVRAAIQAQNTQVSAGQLGGTPAVEGQQLNATISALGRLQTVEDFDSILLRTNAQGGNVYLRDVARTELGSDSYGIVARYNGKPAAGIAIRLAAGANALTTANAVKAKVEELSRYFPAGVKYVVPFDTTPFVKISIEEVVYTLIEAIILVFFVMWLFLQNIRATLIPTIAVPVVLLGTFGVLSLFGYSINTLTMFATVLAIGLLVDDAIVVVENVERIMSEEGLSPKEATRKSMDQIVGALIGIALVLSAVFVPMAFFGGSTGVIYRQFSVTIVSAMALSVLVAVILTPALCATLLKPLKQGEHFSENRFFRGFNRLFDRGQKGYVATVGKIIGQRTRYLVIYLLIVGVMGVMFAWMPTSFLPDEDQGILFTQIQLPAGATLERTLKVLDTVEDQFLNNEKEAADSLFTVAGFSFGGSGQNMGLGFVKLKPWEERKRPDLKVKSVVGRAMGSFSKIRDAMAFAFAPPAVVELGNATGFDVQLQDRAALGHEALINARNMFLGMAMKDKRLVGVRPNGQDDMAEYKLDIDQAKANAQGVTMSEVNDMLSTAWGSSYVNDFIDRGRVKKVYLQGDAPYRMLPEDLNKWHVRNKNGEMVPFSSFASAHWSYGSPRLERYNGSSSVEIMGQGAPGVSTGEAMDAVAEIAGKLPPGIGYEWPGVSFEEKRSRAQARALYAISWLVVL